VTVNDIDFRQLSSSSLVVAVAKAAFKTCRIAGRLMPALFFPGAAITRLGVGKFG
jgi:hypothetical protein